MLKIASITSCILAAMCHGINIDSVYCLSFAYLNLDNSEARTIDQSKILSIQNCTYQHPHPVQLWFLSSEPLNDLSTAMFNIKSLISCTESLHPFMSSILVITITVHLLDSSSCEGVTLDLNNWLLSDAPEISRVVNLPEMLYCGMDIFGGCANYHIHCE